MSEKKTVSGQVIAAEKRREFTIEERQTKALELWLVKKKSYREIAKVLGISTGQVGNDVNAAIAKAAESLKMDLAVNVRREFGEQLKFAKKLRQAAEDYLSSDTDPMKLVLIPRADEIDIAYYDFADTTSKGEPKKKTATLHALLAKVEGLNIEADKITIRHVDMRKFALDAINTTDTCIDKFSKLGGDYANPRNNPADNLSIAKMVVAELLAKGESREDAIEFAVGRYGVLEADLLNA
jgi:hypothetical protein